MLGTSETSNKHLLNKGFMFLRLPTLGLGWAFLNNIDGRCQLCVPRTPQVFGAENTSLSNRVGSLKKAAGIPENVHLQYILDKKVYF